MAEGGTALFRRCLLWTLMGCVAGCAYVTRAEFLEVWDEDLDGFPIGDDCAPTDPAVHPGAADPRGDGCDTDCGREPDQDVDDWPDAADCGPTDPTIFPCSGAEVAGDGVDHDCDGLDGVRLDVCPGIDPDYPEAQPYTTCPGTPS